MIKTIIFDLGGVYFTDGTKKAIGKISKKYKVSRKKTIEALKGKLGAKYRIGKLTQEDFWRKARRLLKIDTDIEDLSHLWVSGYVPIKGTVQIIDRLRKKKRYELLFLSDNVQERVDYLDERYHFTLKFKDGVFSHIIGVKKPNLKIYKACLERTLSRPEECLFIDDKPENVAAAKKLGMKAIHFKSPSKLKAKLKEFDVEF
jgi:putative hydrolase of the HAD superfamily